MQKYDRLKTARPVEGKPKLRATKPEQNPGCVQKALLGREAEQVLVAGKCLLLARPLQGEVSCRASLMVITMPELLCSHANAQCRAWRTGVCTIASSGLRGPSASASTAGTAHPTGPLV